MRTPNDSSGCPQSWVLESSNSGEEGDWTKLDEQLDNTIFMPNKPATHTFEIKSHKSHVSYRYLRIRTTGQNNNNGNLFVILSIEFFGIVHPKIKI